MKVLFRFGDNDFQFTFKQVFKLLQVKLEMHGGTLLDKQQICDFINTLSWPIFYALQEGPSARFPSVRAKEAFFREYFQAYPKDILLNAEVDHHLRNNANQANYAWFVYDSTQADPNWQVYVV